MILVKLAEMSLSPNRLGDTPAHVRIAIHEPVPKDGQQCESIKNPRSIARWFAEAGQSFEQAVTKLFSFKLQPQYKYHGLIPSAVQRLTNVHGAIKLYEVLMEDHPPAPTIRTYNLGEYVLDGIAHDVIGFLTEGLAVKLNDEDYRLSVVYQLNTAWDLAEEEFFDHLHIELTKLGFNTLYTKRSCMEFEDLYGDKDGMRILRSKAGPKQAVHIRVEPHDPEMSLQLLTIIAADQKDQLFSFDEKELRYAVMSFYNWNFRVELDPGFKWLE